MNLLRKTVRFSIRLFIGSSTLLLVSGCLPSNPDLSVSPAKLNFGIVSTTATRAFALANEGGGDLGFNVLTNNKSELNVSPTVGTVTGDSADISVTIDLTSYNEGPFGIPTVFAEVIQVVTDVGKSEVEIFALKGSGANPVVASVVPNSGPAGTTVTVTGGNFTGAGKTGGLAQGGGEPEVWFDFGTGQPLPAVVNSFSSTEIECVVPDVIFFDEAEVIVVRQGFSGNAPVNFARANDAGGATGTAAGIVFDRLQQDARVPFAEVVFQVPVGQDLVHVQTFQADEEGVYRAPDLPIGSYIATARTGSFVTERKTVVINRQITPDDFSRVDFGMGSIELLTFDFNQEIADSMPAIVGWDLASGELFPLLRSVRDIFLTDSPALSDFSKTYYSQDPTD